MPVRGAEEDLVVEDGWVQLKRCADGVELQASRNMNANGCYIIFDLI